MKNVNRKIVSALLLVVVVICGSKTSKGQAIVVETPEVPSAPIVFDVKSKSEIKAMVSEKISSLSFIEMNNSSKQTKIYPNPSAGKMNIAIKDVNEGDITIVVSDIQGRERIRKNVYHDRYGAFYENIDATEIPDGLYKITVIHNDFTLVKVWSKGLN